LIVAAAVFFGVFSVALTVSVLALSGRTSAGPRWLRRVPVLKDAIVLVAGADPRLVHNLALIVKSGGYQLAILLLDVATIWVLIFALGQVASPTGVFVSFMISTLLRTIGIFPGGLGTFEAASVVTLKLAGVPIAVALAATLLFRGLSFWLPMLPGLVFSREAGKRT
jgi:Mg2+-importing ATPase